MLADPKAKRKPHEYGKVAVLLGGRSAEREVSLVSGQAVFNALIKQGVNAVTIDPTEDLITAFTKENVDRVFIVLHGRDGEDGVIQGFLKVIGLPFTGSDVSSSAIAMNKLYCKQIWQQLGISTAEYVAIYKQQNFSLADAGRLLTQLGSPLFVKPVKEGSSVGMSKVETAAELCDAIDTAHQFDDAALVEQFVAGKEYTVTILNQRALPSVSMRTPRDFYDYEAKYQSNTTEYFCPSGLSASEENQLAKIALKAFYSIGCSGWGRVDFIRDDVSGEFMILEVNTVPGMTESSLVPKAAASLGISFDELVLQILDTSFADDMNTLAGEKITIKEPNRREQNNDAL